jgi:hypothetical protein
VYKNKFPFAQKIGIFELFIDLSVTPNYAVGRVTIGPLVIRSLLLKILSFSSSTQIILKKI